MKLNCHYQMLPAGCLRLVEFINESSPLTDSSWINRYRYAMFHALHHHCIYRKRCPLYIKRMNSRSLFS